MLTELQRLHAGILAGLDELDALTAQPDPPMDRIPAVRLAITRASRARTMLLERIYDQLVTRAPLEQKARILVLKEEGKDNLAASTGHIGIWTLREIAGRWHDYRAASNTMRYAMRRRIKNEAELIYPLLSDHSL
ncbi:hypothetical protein [Sphingomonas sp. PAMC 26621]|uniref:hypothetical protein n=1 Tax=Sphingomonas sp. PAMC 26621 TaxID=1112213 RepID=UPI0011111742|nr:hypothetical protein [Sphingomonas sp. PAMC 26621]